MTWIKTEENLYINLDKFEQIKTFEIDGHFDLTVDSMHFQECVIASDESEEFIHLLAAYILSHCNIEYIDISKFKKCLKDLKEINDSYDFPDHPLVL